MRVISNRRGARLSGLLVLLLFLGAVLLATGWFVARTEGARGMMETRLSDRLGMPVTVGSSRIGWPYALVLRDVATAGGGEAGTPGIMVWEMRIGRRLRFWDVELRHVAVRVRDDGAGAWTPMVAARLADLRQASAVDINRLTASWRRCVRLRVSDGMLAWLDAEGREDAALHDIHFRMEPVRLPEGRRMTYYSLRIYAASGGAMGNVRDLDWAWLVSADQGYVELVRTARFAETLGSRAGNGHSEADYAE